MNLHAVFCPNSSCPASGRPNEGQIWIHDAKRRRYRCTVCRKTFRPTTGTPLTHKQYPIATIVLVVTLLAYGCPVAAIVAAFRLDARTVRRWMQDAGEHAERLHQTLVVQPRPTDHVQADELRVRLQGGVVWVAMAVLVRTRLWLGATLSPQRDQALITPLLVMVRSCVQVGQRLVLVTDGWRPYARVVAHVFRHRIARHGRRGRGRLRPWVGLVFVQLVKTQGSHWRPWCRVALTRGRRLAWVLARSCGWTTPSTACIERLNGTFRQRLAALARRTRHGARTLPRLHGAIYLVGTIYNFCTRHQTLAHTPAMAAGITDRCWTVEEFLRYRIPPPYQPIRRRGRPTKAEQALRTRWGR